MIIGNGDIASVLPERSDLTFFASGVSNSKEDRESEYLRERRLMYGLSKMSHIVYFSSLAIFYSDTRYTRHKLQMEKIVKGFNKYTIIRLGNITWGDNPHTLINYVRERIKNKETFEIRDEYRYIINKDEFLHWINLIPEWSCEMNLPGRRMKVSEIVSKYGYA